MKRSFAFGLWVGFVAGVTLAALLKRNDAEPTMMEKLLPPQGAPTHLAQALAQQDKMRAAHTVQ